MYENIDEWLQNLTSARHSWPLSSEGSFACHTFCDTGHPIILVISEDPWKFLLKVWLWSCNYLYLRLRSVASMLVKNKCKIANDLTSSRNFQHYNSHLLIIIIHPSKLLHKINNKHCKALRTLRPSVSLTTNVHRNNNSFFLNYKVSTPNAFDKEYIYNTLSTTKGINVCYNRYGNLYLSLSFYYI